MIKETTIRHIIEEKIKGSDLFIVEICVNQANKITVYLDSPKGVTINDCIEISRCVESKLDREKEDFALEVSSAGLTMPFKIKEQYVKNIGKSVKIKTLDGQILKGNLLSCDEQSVVIESEKKEKKEKLMIQIRVDFDNIKETKLDLIF
ncbi:MAG: ribosome assembly cofactor RimP [Bacteroidales bacterium]|nr:ribosome assembly cofactor RimP [Bacteroidales bacterium]